MMAITKIVNFLMLKSIFCIFFISYELLTSVVRFHLLQEFDEGKKSCRSRLAKHNGRRRKAPAQAKNSSSENHSLTNTLLLLLRQLAGQDCKFL